MVRGPIRPELGEGYCLDYGGEEQRLAWAIDDTELAENVDEIKQKICSKFIEILPAEVILETASSTLISVNQYSALRFLLSIANLPATELVEICLQGTFDGVNWFDFTNGSYKFIKNGLYTITISPVISSQARINYKVGNADLIGSVGASY